MVKIKFIKPIVLYFVSFLFIFFLLNLKLTRAEDFTFDYQVKNTITSDLKLISEYTITVNHISGDGFISLTEITYPLQPDSVIATSGLDKLISAYDQDTDGNFTIRINQKPILGKGAKFTYVVKIISSKAVEKKGNILDVFIPEVQVNNNTSVSKNLLYISKLLPPIEYISKKAPQNVESQKLDSIDKDYLHFSYNDSSSISLILGQLSKYSYTLTVISKEAAIYVPSNFPNQNIIISSIDNAPINTILDQNNQNTSLTFGSSTTPITLKGEIEIQTDRYKSDPPKNDSALDHTFWKYDDRLKSVLDAAISQTDISSRVKLTIESLSKIVKYDSNDLKVQRLPISDLLSQSISLHSLNISDLMVTVLRQAGINTRLVGGFVDAQLQNEFQNNGLHFWIEYFDPNFGGWKSADPTLQLISPFDNFYDGVGLSHITVFKSSSGLDIPSASTYSWSAKIQSGTVSSNEQLQSRIITDKLLSGKDKTINIEVKNTGNTITSINTVNISEDNLNSSITTTDINKAIFPNQTIEITAKIKNDNFYEDRLMSVNAVINTQTENIKTPKDIKLERSSPQILIGLIVGLAIFIIIASIIIISRRKTKSAH